MTIDYHLLNDGSDEEAGPEDRITKKSRLNLPIEGSEPITHNDSASQWTPSYATSADSTSADCSQEQISSVKELPESSRVSDQSSTPPTKSQNLSLWSHFSINSLPGKLWYPKRGKKGPIEDREIRCTMCNWKTTDSARATSTSNMKLHLNRHGISSSGGHHPGVEERRMRQQSVATMFRKSAKDNVAKILEQNLLVELTGNLLCVELNWLKNWH
ncbi:hypothetical protein V1508DRAFT_458196 [Lipomyces doorenjongii]|uniref:uncharacterized protein n=1 Tax=Lipomyces doorenjongii TaxID=383834 RepID=UPI0034CD0448